VKKNERDGICASYLEEWVTSFEIFLCFFFVLVFSRRESVLDILD